MANPGPFTLTSTGGSAQIGAASGSFAPPNGLVWEGAIDTVGNLSFPAEGIEWPVLQISALRGGSPEIDGGSLQLRTARAATGVLELTTGTVYLTVPVNYTASLAGTYSGYTFEITCTVDRTPSATPLVLTWPGWLGAPYDQATGALKLVDGLFVLPGPAEEDCEVSGDIGVEFFASVFVNFLGDLVSNAPGQNWVYIESVLTPPIRSPDFVLPAPPPPPPPPAPAPVAAGPIMGTAGIDVLVGTPGNDTFYGLAGNDTIKGLGGNDVIIGGAGNDRLIGGAGADRLLGGAGRDTLHAKGGGKDSLNGNIGRDSGSWSTGDRVKSVERRLA